LLPQRPQAMPLVFIQIIAKSSDISWN